MSGTLALETVMKRDRLVVIAGLFVVVALAAAYTIAGIGMSMSALTMTKMAVEMPGMAMQPAAWSPGYAALIFLMWWVMMVAMMVPSAAPAVLLYAAIARRQRQAGPPLVATALFLGGYLAVWALFSLVAAGLQWGLESIGVVTGMMEIASPVLAGLVLVAAGLYQLTPLKQACLRHCRSPLMFIAEHWRPGPSGAFRMGLSHGGYCLGCCWFLMALLFVGGIMNLIWIAGLAVYVGLEKFAGHHRWLTTGTGVALTLAGLAVLARPLLSA
jgi:predicted metal-binding membrane protein